MIMKNTDTIETMYERSSRFRQRLLSQLVIRLSNTPSKKNRRGIRALRAHIAAHCKMLTDDEAEIWDSDEFRKLKIRDSESRIRDFEEHREALFSLLASDLTEEENDLIREAVDTTAAAGDQDEEHETHCSDCHKQKVGTDLKGLIDREEVCVWIHHSDGTLAVVPATRVGIGEEGIEIEADPTFTFSGSNLQ